MREVARSCAKLAGGMPPREKECTGKHRVATKQQHLRSFSKKTSANIRFARIAAENIRFAWIEAKLFTTTLITAGLAPDAPNELDGWVVGLLAGNPREW